MDRTNLKIRMSWLRNGVDTEQDLVSIDGWIKHIANKNFEIYNYIFNLFVPTCGWLSTCCSWHWSNCSFYKVQGFQKSARIWTSLYLESSLRLPGFPHLLFTETLEPIFRSLIENNTLPVTVAQMSRADYYLSPGACYDGIVIRNIIWPIEIIDGICNILGR